GDAPAHEAAFAELLRHTPALVQPYVAEVATAGEWSLMFFGGAYSHAVLKRPRSGDFRVQEKHGGLQEPAEPTRDTIGQAAAMVAALAELGHGGLAYARIDGVVVAGRLQLMEAELIEPQLFLSGAPHGAANFARALSETLRAR
ncbi:MAG TPA: hypothetical protein VFL14_15735, partial [Xanthomonadales bacterium]|nr:hypothetical protein [Xanthomonadales bacterium]